VSLNLGIPLRSWLPLGPIIALILAAVTHALSLVPAHASEAPSAVTILSSNTVSPTAVGPDRLKQQVRITVETNAPPAEATPTAAVSKEKSFEWKASWEGWNGLQLELTRKTLLGHLLPGGTNVESPTLSKLPGFSTRRTNDYRMRMEEDRMNMNIGAKLAVDGAAYVTGSQFQGFDNGFELRRARVYARGDCLLLLPVSYELEVGYVPSTFYIENSYIAFRNIAWIGDLKLGQYQAPMGLDIVTSSRDINLMEPASVLEALAPGVNAGIQIGRPVFDRRATWTLGLFTEGGGGQDFGEATKNYGRAITRLTGLPIYRVDPDHPESATLLHLGLSANILYSTTSSVQYRSRPESHLAPYVVDTGEIAADGAVVVGGEAAWVNGPFSLQAEYLHSWVHETNGQVPGFSGVYVMGSWFLTGESRPYDQTLGAFTRLIPRKNFNWGKGGWGAWELAARYSYVNLDSADVNGGRLSMLMTGVNWYLHSHAILRFEYGFGKVSARQPEGNLNIFQTRFEVDL
jgi:phosphate-selective porin OprO and OprP